MKSAKQLCTFFMDDQCFGIDAGRVQEILRRQVITPVPHAPDWVKGLVNLRGQIIVAMDLRRRLSLAQAFGRNDDMNIVVMSQTGPVSLLVERVGDVLDVDAERFEPPPSSIPGQMRRLIEGVHQRPDQLVIVLALDHVISHDSDRSTLHGE